MCPRHVLNLHARHSLPLTLLIDLQTVIFVKFKSIISNSSCKKSETNPEKEQIWNVFIGYCRRHIRSAVIVVAWYSSERPRHKLGTVIGSNIRPSDPNPEATLSSSFPSSFTLLSQSSYLSLWFEIALYVLSQQRPSMDSKTPSDSMQ